MSARVMCGEKLPKWTSVGLAFVLCLAPMSVMARGSRRSSGGHASKSYRSKQPKYSSGSDKKVKSYTKKNGTYVESYHRKAPNITQHDNYGTKHNVNPYTGKEGRVEPKK